MHVYFDVGFSGLCWTARLVLSFSDCTEYHVVDLKVASESGAVELSSHHPIKSFLRHPQMVLVRVAVIVAANLNVPVYHHVFFQLFLLLLLLLLSLLLFFVVVIVVAAAAAVVVLLLLLVMFSSLLVWCNTITKRSILSPPPRCRCLENQKDTMGWMMNELAVMTKLESQLSLKRYWVSHVPLQFHCSTFVLLAVLFHVKEGPLYVAGYMQLRQSSGGKMHYCHPDFDVRGQAGLNVQYVSVMVGFEFVLENCWMRHNNWYIQII